MAIKKLKIIAKNTPNLGEQKIIGYARVSTKNQTLEEQIASLQKYGCTQIYSEHASGAEGQRQPELTKAIATLTAGDVFVAVALDRVGRTLNKIIDTLNKLVELGVEVKIIRGGMNFSPSDTGAVAKAMRAFFALCAEMERDLLVERLAEGRKYAAEHFNRKQGRKHSLNEEQVQQVKALVAQGVSKAKIGKTFKVAPRTLYRYLDGGK